MFLLHTRKTLLHKSSSSSLSSYYYCFYSTSKLLKHESSSTLPSPNPSALLTQKHHIAPLIASRVASALSPSTNPQNLDSVISFLKDNGFSQTQFDNFIQRCPLLLAASLDYTIKPKFNCFKDFGFTDSEIADILSKQPWILQASLSNRIAPNLPVLHSLLGSHARVVKLLMTSSWFLVHDLEKKLIPNIHYLTSCGVQMDQIHRFLYRNSRFFLNKLQVMKQFVAKAEQLGADRSSGMFLHAVNAVASCSEETWERKVQGFRQLGFSEDDILILFRKTPHVFNVSFEKVSTIKEVLFATGKYTMKSIISNPTALMVSVDKRYKPRLRVLEVLEGKNLIKEWPSLAALFQMTDDKFFERFVAPHGNEISQVLPKAAIR